MNQGQVNAIIEGTSMKFKVSQENAKDYFTHLGHIVTVPSLGPLCVQEIELNEQGQEKTITFVGTSTPSLSHKISLRKNIY
jgi:hypothetical protein